MEIFWTLIEPILTAYPVKKICEIGVAEGAFTARLLAWGPGAWLRVRWHRSRDRSGCRWAGFRC